jgi:hypothetical protein
MADDIVCQNYVKATRAFQKARPSFDNQGRKPTREWRRKPLKSHKTDSTMALRLCRGLKAAEF